MSTNQYSESFREWGPAPDRDPGSSGKGVFQNASFPGNLIRLKAHWYQIAEPPDDHKFQELALSEAVEAIIAAEKDLLELHLWHGIAIITTRDFVGSS